MDPSGGLIRIRKEKGLILVYLVLKSAHVFCMGWNGYAEIKAYLKHGIILDWSFVNWKIKPRFGSCSGIFKVDYMSFNLWQGS